MNNNPSILNLRLKTEIFIITLAFFLFLARTAITPLKIPFIILLFSIIVYTIAIYKSRIFNKIFEFIKYFWVIFCLAAILILSFFLSNKLYLTVFKEICSSIILIFLYFLLSFYITKKVGLDFFYKVFIRLSILFGALISLIHLGSLFDVFYFGSGAFTRDIASDAAKEYLLLDYNFGLLYVLFGMVSLIYSLQKSKAFIQVFFGNLLLTFFSIDVFFSSSRRGSIILIIIIILCLVSQLFAIFHIESFITKIGKKSRIYLISLLCIVIISYLFISKSSYEFKNKTLEAIGSRNLVSTKEKVALRMFKYYSIFNKNKSYKEVYNTIWTPGSGPNDPDSGWGTTIHKTVYPLKGDNVHIVPKTARGYLMDNTCNADTAEGYAFSATWIGDKAVDENITLEASVYCYLSNDCDLTMAEICSLGAMGNPGASYDMTKKGTWQKLSFSVNCSKGNASVLLFFSKFGVTNFSLLKGYIIFAYPQVHFIEKMKRDLERINPGLPILPNKNVKTACDLKSVDKLDTLFYIEDKHLDSTKPETVDFQLSDDVGMNSAKYYSAGFINFERNIHWIINSQLKDKDFIRNLASKLISEDTTYSGFSKISISDSVPKSFIEARTKRWYFAIQIFTKEYDSPQKIFGGGFKFLNWYGKVFYGDRTKSDYPHNPFLSVLLYSGILGFILYCYFLSKALYYYLKYIKVYYLLFIFFIITFFFSFFSAGSPFDPPMMGFFVILPFFIDYIHAKEEYTTTN
jgi:hypothetical protein